MLPSICLRRISTISRSNWEPDVLSRRDFLATASAAAVFRGTVSAQPAKYDLVIRGGRVIDPSARLDAIRDVAITNGRIRAIAASIRADAAAEFDARGKLVVPGLLDIHTHAARTTADGPKMVLED